MTASLWVLLYRQREYLDNQPIVLLLKFSCRGYARSLTENLSCNYLTAIHIISLLVTFLQSSPDVFRYQQSTHAILYPTEALTIHYQRPFQCALFLVILKLVLLSV